MTDEAGAWEKIAVNGVDRPLYIIQFDKDGACISPGTRDALLRDLSKTDYTHVLFFSHGWNNDWQYVTSRYRTFLNRFHALGNSRKALPSSYVPLFVGVFWPSVSLLLPWEKGPGLAAAADGPDDELDPIASLLQEPERTRFLKLAKGKKLDRTDSLELAQIFASIAAPMDDVTQTPQPSLTAGELVATWRAAPLPAQPTAIGDDKGLSEPRIGVAPPVAPRPGSAQTASALDYLDPRWVVRLGTVRIMKDRAGIVGSAGVADLLNSILASAPSRVHAIGHSYGAKVLLSAATKLKHRKITSLLLLQPAVSYLSFSSDIGTGAPGGYSGLAKHVEKSVFATYSANDFPLRRVYHFALRRESDLGEVRPAATAPSRYAALGGYGAPESREAFRGTLPAPGTAFPAIGPSVLLSTFDGTAAIGGHGDVLNDAVYWALMTQCADQAN